MGKYKICVYAICKNEEKFVERWMNSMGEADIVVVTDTGSSDGTVKELIKNGASVYLASITPWRFDTARNVSLSHVPDDVDICVCTDLDEILEPLWREKLECAWEKSKTTAKMPIARTGTYLYNWSLKPDGSPDIQFHNFKVHDRHGFTWKCPVHEYLSYEGPLTLMNIFIDGMVLNHYPDGKKSRASYLELLELAVEEEPFDARMRYYLGREYMYKMQWQNCINTMKEFLTLPTAVWNEERCSAMRFVATSYLNLGKREDAFKWYYQAIAEAPHLRDAYVEFAKMCYELGDWPMTLFLAEEALKIKKKSSTYINMGYSWDHTPNDLCAIAAYRLNMMDRAFAHAKLALSYAPKDERLKENLRLIENAKKNSKSN